VVGGGNAFNPIIIIIIIISDEDHGAMAYAETRHAAFSSKADKIQQRW
jgi:hypothetical protein